MTDISITAANVVAGSNSRQVQGSAGETIAAGKVVYKADATKKWMLADSNAVTAEARGSTDIGIALNTASLNQPLIVHTGGDLTAGGTLTAGVAYYLSDTPGGLCPVADVGTGEYVCQIGLATSSSVLAVAPKYTGVAN